MLPANLLPLLLVAVLSWRMAAPLPLIRHLPWMPSPIFALTFLSLLALYLLFTHFIHPVADAGCRLARTIVEEDAHAYLFPPGPPLELSPLPVRRLLAKQIPTITKPVVPSWPADQPRRSCLHYRANKAPEPPPTPSPPSPWKPGRGILRSAMSDRRLRQPAAKSVSFAPDATLHQYTHPSAGGILRPARSSHVDLEPDLDEDPLDRPWPPTFRRNVGFNETVRVATVDRWISPGEDHWIPIFMTQVLPELIDNPPTLRPAGNRDADGDVEME